ncbi:hypothetical protein PV328_006505 [Microctonus aethiopoides]|uniref:Protein MCM10 homolog n=1 Tax=Microctonus aethiopoides TaxID=144406 RepID=A0AA39FQ18_9HYME|nr:hypothetical protein PV328_006505 [Microctonus aethiopoides]
MSENDNDDCNVEDILGDLLANDDESDSNDQPPKTVLKELDFNFLDDVDNSTNKITEVDHKKELRLLNHDEDSSDEDDKKYFEDQKYSEAGKEIKLLLKNQEFDQNESSILKESPVFKSSPMKNNSSSWDDVKEKVKNNTFVKSPKSSITKSNNSIKDKAKTGPLIEWLNKPSDIYTDPIFGLRIITPLVSSAELKERMKDRTAVTVSRVKQFISTQNLDNDWVISGVLIQRSSTKKSQKGSQYCIWTISDLSENINKVSIFLFKNAYKLFWKTAEGSVVGILNPNILESRNDNVQATLSVDVAQKIMILGTSKDMGKCKSKKKNGDLCGNIVNINRCEYCIYHVKQEYNKASRRSDLQTDINNRRFGNNLSVKPKSSAPGIYSQGNHHNMLAIPAKRNLKMEQKDSERLAMLRGATPSSQKPLERKMELANSKSCMVELTREQAKKDQDRLNKIRNYNLNKPLVNLPLNSNTSSILSPLKPTSTATIQEKKPANSLAALSIPRLSIGLQGDTIDFSTPIPKKRINSAKMNAINWIKQNGGIKQANPNKIGESREKIEATSKRRRNDDEKEEMPKAKKMNSVSDKFKELLEMESAHTDLIEKSQDNEKEKYFNKLEAKERMEEKMINTFKVECKAVKCLICRYTALSASDLCKEKKHPLRVFDAIKSFFKCSDCGNRTVSLDRIPSLSCNKCKSSNWVRAAMMDEKKMNISSAALSIRGGEQKFMGSDVKDTNLNLLVPESDNN